MNHEHAEHGMSTGDLLAKTLGYGDEETVKAYRAEGHTVDDEGQHSIDCGGCALRSAGSPPADTVPNQTYEGGLRRQLLDYTPDYDQTAEDAKANAAQRLFERLLDMMLPTGDQGDGDQGDGDQGDGDVVAITLFDFKAVFLTLAAQDHAWMAVHATRNGLPDMALKCLTEAKQLQRELSDLLGGELALHAWRLDMATRLTKAAEIMTRNSNVGFHTNPF